MKKSPLWLGFALASSMAMMQSALFPAVAFSAYAPFLALTCLCASYHKALWIASLCGLWMDLLSAGPFGTYALNFLLATALLHRLRIWFFQDKPLLLCVYTALISSVLMPLQMALLFLFDRRAPYAGQWALFDMAAMPLLDAAYAFFWFIGPLMLWDWGWEQWQLWRLKHNEAK